MSHKELDRYQLIQQCLKKELTEAKTASLMGISIRQVQRLKAGVRERGPSALIHGNRGKPGNRAMPSAERKRIASLLHEHYRDFGPAFASEKLKERHAIDRDPKTVRNIQIAEKLWKPRRGKAKSEHRSWRQRKDCYGEMIQFDGSYEPWFEGREGTGEVCLLAAIDDATGKLLDARFGEHEGVFPVFGFWKAYVAAHGKPRAIYVDKFSTYRMHIKEARENTDTKTQFQRAMASLGIEPIFANSAQAKGRVERLFGTLQDRLIKELRLQGISTTEDANQFLTNEFIKDFNQRFAVAPRRKANLHHALTAKERANLTSVFSRHTGKVVQNDFTVQHDNQFYQLTERQPVTVCKKDRVILEEWLDHTVHIRLRGKELAYQLLPARPKPARTTLWVLPASAPNHTQKSSRKPAIDHPWKRRFHADALVQQAVKG